MPISEDEYDLRQGQEAQTTMSKAELRKVESVIKSFQNLIFIEKVNANSDCDF